MTEKEAVKKGFMFMRRYVTSVEGCSSEWCVWDDTNNIAYSLDGGLSVWRRCWYTIKPPRYTMLTTCIPEDKEDE